MLTRLLFAFIFSLMNVSCALADIGEGLLHYRLEVSFDIQASKVSGIAKIPVVKGQEIKIERGS